MAIISIPMLISSTELWNQVQVQKTLSNQPNLMCPVMYEECQFTASERGESVWLALFLLWYHNNVLDSLHKPMVILLICFHYRTAHNYFLKWLSIVHETPTKPESSHRPNSSTPWCCAGSQKKFLSKGYKTNTTALLPYTFSGSTALILNWLRIPSSSRWRGLVALYLFFPTNPSDSSALCSSFVLYLILHAYQDLQVALPFLKMMFAMNLHGDH